MLACRELSRVYAPRGADLIRAVDGMNLQIHDGEFVVIVGRSGAGKTTLLNLMGGLDRATSGGVFIDGRSLQEMSNRQLALLRRQKVGFVFQSHSLLPAYTVFENIEIALAPGQLSRQERRHRVGELLDAFGLAERANHRPLELSAGQQQRVAMARAVANHPTLVLADEPTAQLDPITAREVLTYLEELNRSFGHTLVVATHGAFVSAAVTDVIFIKEGGIVSREDAGYLLDYDVVESSDARGSSGAGS